MCPIIIINSPCKIEEAWTRITRQESLKALFGIQFLFREWCDPNGIMIGINQCWSSVNTKGRKGVGELERVEEGTERKEKRKERFQGKKKKGERINSKKSESPALS